MALSTYLLGFDHLPTLKVDLFRMAQVADRMIQKAFSFEFQNQTELTEAITKYETTLKEMNHNLEERILKLVTKESLVSSSSEAILLSQMMRLNSDLLNMSRAIVGALETVTQVKQLLTEETKNILSLSATQIGSRVTDIIEELNVNTLNFENLSEDYILRSLEQMITPSEKNKNSPDHLAVFLVLKELKDINALVMHMGGILMRTPRSNVSTVDSAEHTALPQVFIHNSTGTKESVINFQSLSALVITFLFSVFTSSTKSSSRSINGINRKIQFSQC